MALEKLRAKRDELFKQLQQVMTEIALHEVTEKRDFIAQPGGDTFQRRARYAAGHQSIIRGRARADAEPAGCPKCFGGCVMEFWRWMILWQVLAVGMVSACTPRDSISEAWFYHQWETKKGSKPHEVDR